MNLKQILNAVLTESGFLEKPAFTSSADPDDKQMVSVANRVAYQTMNFFNWTGLRKTWNLTMTAATTYPIPDDFQCFVSDSYFQRESLRRVEFPVPDSRWFSYKYGIDEGSGIIRARKYGSNLEIPNPEPGEPLQFEYTTKYPITDSGGVPKQQFTNDTDLWLLDDEILILGIQTKWGQNKLLPQYEEWGMEYRAKMNEAIARDVGSRTIGGRMAGRKLPSPYYPLYRSS